MAEMVSFSQTPKLEQRKRRRRRKPKAVCASAQKNCSTAELQLILTELDGNRAIERAADGRRIRTQVTLVAEQSKVKLPHTSLNSKKERKLKNLLVTSYLEKSHDYINNKNKVESLVLPIEQMLALVEVIA